MATRNSIFIGFVWSQAFQIPVEQVPVGSSLRIDWKKDRLGEVLIRSTHGDGISRADTVFSVSFTAAQTTLLTAGRLTGELVEERSNGSERIIGARVIVPVVTPFAEPTP